MKLLRQLHPAPTPEFDYAGNERNIGYMSPVGGVTPGNNLPTLIQQANGTPDYKNLNTGSFQDYMPENLTPEEQRLYRQAATKGAPTGALRPEDYYPDLHHNIGVGNYSGSEIGSTTLFAPGGGLVPLGMMDARDAAIHKAALDKLKEQEEFNKRFKNPETKHTVVQGALTDQYFNGIKKFRENAMAQAGGDPSLANKILYNSPKFNKWHQSQMDIAKFHDQIVDHKAELETMEKDPNFVLSPNTRKAADDIMSGLAYATTHPFSEKGHEIGSNFLKARALYDLDKLTNIAVDKAIPKVEEGAIDDLAFKTRGKEELADQIKQTYFPKEQIDALAHNTYMQHYQGTDVTEDDVRSAIESKMQPKIEHQIKNYTKYYQPREGKENEYANAVPQTSATINQEIPNTRAQAGMVEGGTRPVYMENVYNTTAKDQSQELSFALNKDIINLSGKQLTGEAGHIKGNIQQIGSIPFYKNENRFLKPDEVEALRKNGNLYQNKSIEWKPGAIVNITPKTSDKGKVSKSESAFVPIGSIRSKLGPNFEPIIDKVEADADSKNIKEKEPKKEQKGTTQMGAKVELKVGEERGGYKYIGGDPSKQSSWQAVKK